MADSEAQLDIAANGFFGVGLNEHFLTYGLLAPSPALTKAPSTPPTAANSKRSAENLVNEYVS